MTCVVLAGALSGCNIVGHGAAVCPKSQQKYLLDAQVLEDENDAAETPVPSPPFTVTIGRSLWLIASGAGDIFTAPGDVYLVQAGQRPNPKVDRAIVAHQSFDRVQIAPGRWQLYAVGWVAVSLVTCPASKQ
ncbi:MAG TPA: hypothetical protein VFN61_08510 [Acidimicrobiales bacterium]|nr:hypothetical protein [Acidimicrobiales bacterium]